MTDVPGESATEQARDRAATDFGGLSHARPRVVVRATSSGDVVQALRAARAQRLSVAARGTGHTTRGQTLVRDGMVIDTAGLNGIEIAGHTATVGAGARWDDVVRATLARGLMPPTLTDYLGLSVGGTLSVGGVGGQSFRHGLQVDQIERLVVVTGESELVACSPDEHEALFQSCLAGLGQCGIIVSATMRLVPAPAVTRVYRVSCRHLASFLEAQAALADCGLAHYLLGSITPAASGWRFEIEVGEYLADARASELPALLAQLDASGRCPGPTDMDPWAHASRLDAMVAEMLRTGTWQGYHPWMDLFVPGRGAHDVISAALSLLDPADLAGGHLMTYPLSERQRRARLVPWPGGRHALLFDVLPCLQAGDDEKVARVQAAIAGIWARARPSGATIYPIGYPVGTSAMTDGEWQRQFGSQWNAFRDSKRRYDPGRLLTPGPGIFPPG